MKRDDYVKLDNLSDTQNHLMNILWSENREMTLDELTKQINGIFATKWNRGEIRQFMEALVIKEYVRKQRHKLKTYYAALGLENTEQLQEEQDDTHGSNRCTEFRQANRK